MIHGHVHSHEAIVELEIASTESSHAIKIESVIDTGYNGQLTLPFELVSQLQLSFVGHRRGQLADGSITVLNLYLAHVEWHVTHRLPRENNAKPENKSIAPPLGSGTASEAVNVDDVTFP